MNLDNPRLQAREATRLAEGLRTVALLEATKGIVVLLAGMGMFALLHQDVQALAERLVQHAQLNLASHYPRIFLDLAAGLNDRRLWQLAAAALAYALLRMVEAYGLWRRRQWAQWLAALSGGIYLPFELAELHRQVTGLGLLVLAVNAAIVGFMAYSLHRERAAAAG
ncbi:Uncharacterized membrane protein, DUF2068 family [Noviherbaspirillum humi]|uniref:Uncharacterized membrane protein, DUF2068 family n=1 Tax=Noviherbaspirillum humi TaxID=1688639 RepID=A0A239IS23_9BURK|nr:DUF2127 domain-containing protein [Noviherbaspirillum humi]SNS96586.1 Uncharacterized membrane protein, DUF2068 family [Noviherbaspirillum humi]